MKTLGIIANCNKPRAAEVLQKLHAKAEELELELLADSTTAQLFDPACAVPTEQLFDEADAIVALGGDGTMLRTIRSLGGRETPVLGVNIGGLGFMTSVAEEELDWALECLAGDEVVGSTESIAEAVVVRGGKEVSSYHSLNEVAIWRGPSARVVNLELMVDGDYVTSYVCDGIIVATPTGSTGHSLSAGGPIVTPRTGAFVISVICPHTLSSRPLVVPDRSEICITANEANGELQLAADGQVGELLQEGDCIRIRRSSRSAHFLHLPGHSYFSVLRQKLHWSGHSV